MDKQKRYLEIGKIVTTHGIAGEVRVQPWCSSPDFFTQFDRLYLRRGAETLEVVRARPHKNVMVVKFAGVDTVDAASALIGKILYCDREQVSLPEGTYFIQDLIGLTVVDAGNPELVYGTLTDVFETGANDVYQITDNAGNNVLIPAIPDVIQKTDLAAGRMEITPLKGLFDHED